MAQERTRKRLTSSWSGPSYGVTCAPHVRHFIVHTRRAGHVVTRPLNCGVRRHEKRARMSDEQLKAEVARKALALCVDRITRRSPVATGEVLESTRRQLEWLI